MDLKKNILEHYNVGGESRRLNDFRLEKLRTLSLLQRHLPKAPAKVLDVGGAHGIYAFPLASEGYQVTLVDPVPLHIEQARTADAGAPAKLHSIELGDARQLRFTQHEFDAVLFLGPMYHLQNRDERLQALRSARQALTSGGVFIASYISKFASLIDGIAEGHLADPTFARIVDADLSTGEHRNPTNHPAYFTDAFFHHPSEARSELNEAGFSKVRLKSIEGPVWNHPAVQERLTDKAVRERVLAFLERVEDEESLLGASAHFMAVAER